MSMAAPPLRRRGALPAPRRHHGLDWSRVGHGRTLATSPRKPGHDGRPYGRPEHDAQIETTARTSLRQTLYALRKSLHHADPSAPSGGRRDGRSGFERGDSGRARARAPGGPDDPVGARRGGHSLRGGFPRRPRGAGAPFEDWLLAHRERLREVAVNALSRLLAHQRAAGSHDSAVQTALRLLRLDPLQEPVHRALMQLYARDREAGLGAAPVSVLRGHAPARASNRARGRDEGALSRDPASPRPGDAESSNRQFAPARPTTASTPAGDRRAAAGLGAAAGGSRAGSVASDGGAERGLRGHGRLVVLIGEAGAGKSRLVSELSAAATRAAGTCPRRAMLRDGADPALRALGQRPSGRPRRSRTGRSSTRSSPAGATSCNGSCRSCRVRQSRPHLFPAGELAAAAAEILATRSRRSASCSNA